MYVLCYVSFRLKTCEITTRVFPKIFFSFSFNDQMRPQRGIIVEGQSMNLTSTYRIYKEETGNWYHFILIQTKLK